MAAVKGAGEVATQQIVSKLAGTTPKKYSVKSGKDMRAEDASFNLLVYGESGMGKTKIAVDLLLLGFKVVLVDTDFGRKSKETIQNYFYDHPEHMKFYDNNLMVIDDLDVEGVMAFCRNPASIYPEIYDWNPDVLFWDGMSAYQQGDLEADLCRDDFKRDDADYSTWRGSRNGTIFPLMKFLNQHNINTNKQWHKVVTLMEDERVDRRKGASAAEKKKGEDIIVGSETKGPMLNTTARDLAGAGFSIVLQCLKTTLGNEVTFKYITRGAKIISKDRFGLPAELPGDFKEVYRKYIEPKIKGSAS